LKREREDVSVEKCCNNFFFLPFSGEIDLDCIQFFENYISIANAILKGVAFLLYCVHHRVLVSLHNHLYFLVHATTQLHQFCVCKGEN
jgi:hypothetical protein